MVKLANYNFLIKINPKKQYNLDFLYQLSKKYSFFSIDKETNLITNFPIKKEADAIITFGGDGTLLRLIHEINLEKQIPIYVLDLGRLGFLSTGSVNELEEFLKNFPSVYSERINLLEIMTLDKIRYALNEIIFSRSDPLMVPWLIKIDGITFKIFSDGIIVSTSIGSTAYSYSAGGPIVEHFFDCMIITPISPRDPRCRSMVIEKKPVEIEFDPRYDTLYYSVDGQCITPLKGIEKSIITPSSKYITLLFNKKPSFFKKLKEKLTWGA